MGEEKVKTGEMSLEELFSGPPVAGRKLSLGREVLALRVSTGGLKSDG